MAIKVQLRLRASGATTLHLDARQFKRVFGLDDETKEREALWAMFAGLREQFQSDEIQTTVHDAVWLRQIAEWKPQNKGVKPKDLVVWAGLLKRFAALDEDREGVLTLSDHQATLIRKRLESDDFEFPLVNPAVAGFLVESMDALGVALDDYKSKRDEYEFEGGEETANAI